MLVKGRPEKAFIEVTVTNGCNCRCAYCFEGDVKDIKSDPKVESRQLDLIKEFCENYNPEKYRGLDIIFWGGEPFMNFDYLDKIIEATYKYDFVGYHMYSNGTLTKKIDLFLSRAYIDSIKNRFHIQFSYDGEPHHTIKRGNNRQLVFDNMRKMLDAGFELNFKPTLSYDMIEHLPEIWDSYKELYDMFGDMVSYHPTFDTAHQDEKYFDIWKDVLIEIARKERRFLVEHGRYLWSWFNNDMKKVCRMDTNIHLHTDGKIYNCHGGPYARKKERFILGDIFEVNSLDPIIENNPLNTTGKRNETCEKCSATYCVSCHVSQMSDEQTIDNWIDAMNNNKIKCKYMRYFGKISRILKYSMLRLNKDN